MWGDTWIRINEERGLEVSELIEIAIDWSSTQSSPQAASLAANIVADSATRDQARRFLSVATPIAREKAMWADFQTRRRSLK
jgi:hypothetical protein